MFATASINWQASKQLELLLVGGWAALSKQPRIIGQLLATQVRFMSEAAAKYTISKCG